MNELTEKQTLILELKRDGKTNKDIAGAVGCSENVVRKQLTTIYRKLGIKGGQDDLSKRSLTELYRPEQAATFIDKATDPFGKVAKAMQESGLPASTCEALLRRLRARYRQVSATVRELKTAELIRMLNDRIVLALEYMDEKVVAEASFRDLSLGTSAMIEKRNLLRGEPTIAVDFTTHKRIAELMPLFLAEARRRGMVIDGDSKPIPNDDGKW